MALTTDAIGQLEPHLDTAPTDWRGMVGALEAEIAYVHARCGWQGEAWAHWEVADRIARGLGPGYRHMQSSFSSAVVTAHAVTLSVELCRPGEALRTADTLDPVSAGRRRRLDRTGEGYGLYPSRSPGQQNSP